MKKQNNSKLTWLSIVNILFLQWLGVRLARCSEKIVENYKVESFDFMSDGSISSRGKGEFKKYEWISLFQDI